MHGSGHDPPVIEVLTCPMNKSRRVTRDATEWWELIARQVAVGMTVAELSPDWC
jgi:hypothetical protein